MGAIQYIGTVPVLFNFMSRFRSYTLFPVVSPPPTPGGYRKTTKSRVLLREQNLISQKRGGGDCNVTFYIFIEGQLNGTSCTEGKCNVIPYVHRNKG